MAKLIVLVALAAGCANIHVNRAALVASTLALACDAGQTMRAAREGWKGQFEQNPVMGSHPDQATVAGYFVGAIAINSLVWLVTPDRHKSIVPAGVIGVQAAAIHGNLQRSLGMCGL
jgi:hypothetical protein